MPHRALRLLVVDDSCDEAEMMARVLKRSGYLLQLERVDTVEAMIAALDHRRWDLIACDSEIPRFPLVRLVEIAHALAPHVPLLLVSGRFCDEVPDAVKTGAVNGFVDKNHLQDLPALVTALVSQGGASRCGARATTCG